MPTAADYRALAQRIAAEEFPDDPAMQALYLRLLEQESGFAPDVVEGRRRSSAGALGIAQFMPQTAAALGIDPLNPAEAARAGARYLKQQIAYFGGDVAKGTAAYNAGAGNVERAVARGGANWTAYLPAETQQYLRIVQPRGSLPVAGTGARAGGGGGVVTQRTATATATATATDWRTRARVGVEQQIADTERRIQQTQAALTAAAPGSESAFALADQLAADRASLNELYGTLIALEKNQQPVEQQIAGIIAASTNNLAQLYGAAFGEQREVANLLLGLHKANLEEQGAWVSREIARGTLHLNAAANIVSAIAQQQEAEAARNLFALNLATFIHDQNWQLVNRMLPPGTYDEPGFELGGPLAVAFQDIGLPPMRLPAIQAPRSMVDPVANYQRAQGLVPAVPDFETGRLRDVYTRVSAIENPRPAPITPEGIGVPQPNDYTSLIAGLQYATGLALGPLLGGEDAGTDMPADTGQQAGLHQWLEAAGVGTGPQAGVRTASGATTAGIGVPGGTATPPGTRMIFDPSQPAGYRMVFPDQRGEGLHSDVGQTLTPSPQPVSSQPPPPSRATGGRSDFRTWVKLGRRLLPVAVVP